MSETKALESTKDESPRTLEDLCQLILDYYPKADLDFIRQVYQFSEKAHSGQIRRSGEPYISHPLGVASILAELHLDLATIATGLLHDTVEDTAVSIEDIEKTFGKVVAHLVDGVTKISRMKFRNTHEKQGENIRKMIVAMGKDVRVVLVKLADRLHNMRTLNHMSYEKQARIANETLDIYAPLASRLGISSLKVELEDLSFRYAHPESYYGLVQKVARKKRERDRYIDEVKKLLVTEFAQRTKTKCEVTGRSKHLYSIFRKMRESNIDYEQVFDVLAFRVCVNTMPECYEVLGVVHSLWKPIPGRFKDFIAMPKANNYQSLHTTVVGPGGERIEIQIRTHEMHLVAERGIAAHWQYKEESRGGKEVSDEVAEKFNWLRELVNLHQQTHNPDEFLEDVKTDLFDSEIYVFTPKGDVKELPDGATPIDFAYSVHTDVGHRIVAARVNGRLVSLKYHLKNGDSVEVITSKSQTPSKDWLKFCVTTRARSKIRAHVKAEQRKRAAEIGHQLLEKAFRRHGSSYTKYAQGPEFEKLLKDNGASGLEELLIRVGYGKLMPSHVFERLVPTIPDPSTTGEKDEDSSFLARAFKSAVNKRKKSSSPIRVDGMEDLLVRFGKCCTPIPGDPIMGFITLGRGITIHRADCEKSFELDQARRIDVEWNSDKGQDEGRMVRVRVVSQDIPGLLKSMTEVFSVAGVNIHNAQARTTKDRKAICIFDLSVRNTEQLSGVMSSLMKLKGIIGVTRMTHS